MLKILNPANNTLIKELSDDSAAAIADKYASARAAQKTWAVTPLKERIACLQRFRGIENFEHGYRLFKRMMWRAPR